MASVFSSENRIAARIAIQGTSPISDSGVDIRSLFKELDIRLEETFHFTREQMVSLQVKFWTRFRFVSFWRPIFVECAKTQSSTQNYFDSKNFTLKLRCVGCFKFLFYSCVDTMHWRKRCGVSQSLIEWATSSDNQPGKRHSRLLHGGPPPTLGMPFGKRCVFLCSLPIRNIIITLSSFTQV